MNEQTTDNDLVRQARQGQQHAFGVLVKRYQGRMRAFVSRFVNNRDDVYDIVQDVFLNIYRNINTFDPQTSFISWSYTVCRYHIVDYYREKGTYRNALQLVIGQELAETITTAPNDKDNSLEKIVALKRCIKKLGRAYRQLIHYRYYANAAVKDIADQLGQTAASISMRLYRIRIMLGRCVEKELLRGGRE